MPTYAPIPTIEWHDDYAISLDALDLDAESLFGSLDDYIRSINNRLGAEVIRNKLSALEAHLLRHFEDEERLMAEIAAAGTDAHRREHAAFALRLRAIRRMRQSEVVRAHELLILFRTWIAGHLTVRDREFGRLIAATRPVPWSVAQADGVPA